MLCLCHYGLALLKCWFQTDLGRENSASPVFMQLIGQNLTGEFMRKFIQHLETCLLWQLKLTEFCVNLWCLTVFFHWMYKMKYSCYQESSVIHGWFVYWVFGWEMRRLSKPIIRFRMASFLFFTLLDAYENYKGSSDPCLTW